jgi:hypothetical protein
MDVSSAHDTVDLHQNLIAEFQELVEENAVH